MLVSALEAREDKERGIEVGANAYVVKSSFEQSNLLEIIHRLGVSPRMIRVLIAEDSRRHPRVPTLADRRRPRASRSRAPPATARRPSSWPRSLRPDVILMDVHMPQMDGFQATRLIMERHPTPIVMATASSSKAETRGAFEALDAGALLLLDKPPAPWDPRPRRGGGRARAHGEADGRGQGRPPLGRPARRGGRAAAIPARARPAGGRDRRLDRRPAGAVGDPRRAAGAAQRPDAARPAHLRRLHRGLRRMARDAHADGGGARRARRRAAARHRSMSPARIATWASTARPHRASTAARP